MTCFFLQLGRKLIRFVMYYSHNHAEEEILLGRSTGRSEKMDQPHSDPYIYARVENTPCLFNISTPSTTVPKE